MLGFLLARLGTFVEGNVAMIFTEEQVILLDETGEHIGSASKRLVHGVDTPLHLAFSCYLFNEAGEILMSRRALSKLTWPGVWTNSFCGHPAPGEDTFDAIARRAHEELGTTVTSIEVVDSTFRYRAIDASGVVENEICPVHVARISGPLNPNPEEVGDWAWVGFDELAQAVTSTPFAFSPWLVLQMPSIVAHNAREGGGQ